MLWHLALHAQHQIIGCREGAGAGAASAPAAAYVLDANGAVSKPGRPPTPPSRKPTAAADMPAALPELEGQNSEIAARTKADALAKKQGKQEAQKKANDKANDKTADPAAQAQPQPQEEEQAGSPPLAAGHAAQYLPGLFAVNMFFIRAAFDLLRSQRFHEKVRACVLRCCSVYTGVCASFHVKWPLLAV